MGNDINNFFLAHWNALIFQNHYRAPWHPGDKGYDFEHKTIAGLRVFPVGSRQNILVLKAREYFTRTLHSRPQSSFL